MAVAIVIAVGVGELAAQIALRRPHCGIQHLVVAPEAAIERRRLGLDAGGGELGPVPLEQHGSRQGGPLFEGLRPLQHPDPVERLRKDVGGGRVHPAAAATG